MAHRPKGYGMTAELQTKREEKYDSNSEQELRLWIEELTGEKLSPNPGPMGSDAFGDALKDGIILCKLANAIQPDSVRKVNESKMAFKQMENIGFFLSACEGLGMVQCDLFQTVDLYEKQNMPQVVTTLLALKRTSKGRK